MNCRSIKIKFFALIIFLFSATFSYAEIVKEIIIDGNDRVNSETIKIFGKVKIGNN